MHVGIVSPVCLLSSLLRFRPFQLVVAEVANKFAQSHFRRGVRDQNVRLLTKIVIQYIQVSFEIYQTSE